MPVPILITDLSQTASSNSPAGTEPVGTNANDYHQAAYSFIRFLYDGNLKPLQTVDFNTQKLTNLAPATLAAASKDAVIGDQLNTTNTSVTTVATSVTALTASVASKAPLTGTGTSGTWPISVSGTSANASSISLALNETHGWTGQNSFNSNYGAGASAGLAFPSHQITSGDGGPAILGFQRIGSFGTNIALDQANTIVFGGWSAPANLLRISTSSGDLTALGNITAFSDERLKTDWEDVEVDDFSSKWANVKHGVYKRIDSGAIQLGLSAQSVQAILPNAVIESGSDGLLSLNYGAASAVATIKLAQEIVELKAQLNLQKELINELINRK